MSSTGTKKIYVIFYTTYGHIHKLVQEVVKGINAVSGAEAVLLQVSTSCRPKPLYNPTQNGMLLPEIDMRQHASVTYLRIHVAGQVLVQVT